tara:strand:+ start:7980 stop:8297 length:318 start_codon:yes stop_codon:yes gene_type:complete
MYTLETEGYRTQKGKFTHFRKEGFFNWLTSKAIKKRTCHCCGLKIHRNEKHLAIHMPCPSVPWARWRQNICLFCLEDILKLCKSSLKGIRLRRQQRVTEQILLEL